MQLRLGNLSVRVNLPNVDTFRASQRLRITRQNQFPSTGAEIDYGSLRDSVVCGDTKGNRSRP